MKWFMAQDSSAHTQLSINLAKRISEMFHVTVKSTQCHGINRGSQIMIILGCPRTERLWRPPVSLFGMLTCIQDLHGEAKCLTSVNAEIEHFACSYKAEVPSGLKENT